jgi:protease I
MSSKKKIAFLATDGFEEVELSSPLSYLRERGFTCHVIAPKNENEGRSIRAWDEDDWGGSYAVDVDLDEADPGLYDMLVLPGGVLNPDQLRMNGQAIEFIRNFFAGEKPVAAICHGPQMLIEAGQVAERRMTSYPSIRTDLVNAGANWENEEVVVDGNLITSRSPDDLDAFNEQIARTMEDLVTT